MRNRLSNAIRRFKRPGIQGNAVGWTSYEPNFASLLVSDYVTIAEQSAATLRFLRTVPSGGYDFQNASPGSRVTFNTTATKIRISMFHNDLVRFTGDINNYLSTGAILVDGVEVKTYKWDGAWNETGIVNIELSLASGSKAVTIVWAYWTGFELRKIEVNTGATISAPTARPTAKLAVCGDSITHGSAASKTTTSWAYLLAIAENKQLINMANGGDQANATHATYLAGTGASVVTYMIGYNNFAGQTSLASFQTAVQGWITNARTALPSAAIHVISPIYSPNTDTITLAQYRSAVQAAELAAGDANTFYIDGLSIMTNNTNRLYDGVHPNDTGSAEISTNLAALV
jgi:lysophospholipase L1-like esterase